VAAMTSNQDLRTNIISRVHNRASFNVSAGAFPLSYDSTLGSTLQGVASPAQGAMYAPLALTAPVVQIKANFPQTPSSKASQTSAIAAGVVETRRSPQIGWVIFSGHEHGQRAKRPNSSDAV